MLKIMVSAVAVMAVIGSSALACSGHKSGSKGSTTAAAAPASVIVIVAKA